MTLVYVDNNATTMVAPEVMNEMEPYFNKFYGNPSSMHSFGGDVRKKIDSARGQVSNLLGTSPDEIIFTSCGTESNSTAIFSALRSNPGKKHIITTRVEHPAIKNLCEQLISSRYRITFVPVDKQGCLDTDYLYNAISEDTAIISLMWANNETGIIFPVEEIAKKVTDQGIIFHTDAVQAVGKIPINMSKNTIDMASLSGHKIHAPKGIGALYVRKGTKFSPFFIGGHQEAGRRGGTENVPSIIGLGKAAEIAIPMLHDQNTRVRRLRDKLEDSLIEHIPGAFINGHTNIRLPNTTSISFESVEGESILLMLDEYRICASSGSACTSGSLEPSHVLKAMKVPFEAAHGTIRFSLSVYNTEEDIDAITTKLPRIINSLRQISPFWQESKSDIRN